MCDACQQAKIHQLPYKSFDSVSSFPLELVYLCVWGPARTSVGGYKYSVSFLDDFSDFSWIYFFKHKPDVVHTFLHFQQHVERLFDTKIHTIQTDWGGEYRNLKILFP